MNEYAREYVRSMLMDYPVRGRVLEVGSADMNGNVNDLFRDRTRFTEHVKVDAIEDSNVDIVMHSDELKFKDRSFDCVICLETLEHDPAPWKSMEEFGRVLTDGGYLIVTTCGFGFPYHPCPQDFWRFTGDAVENLFRLGHLDAINLMVSVNNQVFGTAVRQKRKRRLFGI